MHNDPFRRPPMVDFAHPVGQSLFWRISHALDWLVEQLENHSPAELLEQKIDRDIARAEQAAVSTAGAAAKPQDGKNPDLHGLRRGRWYDEKPITTTNTGSTGGAVSSIEEVRAGIMAANEKANEALGAVQQAHGCLETAQGALMRATEGSGQADVSEATGLLAQAVNSLHEVGQQVSASISASEGVANRL